MAQNCKTTYDRKMRVSYTIANLTYREVVNCAAYPTQKENSERMHTKDRGIH